MKGEGIKLLLKAKEATGLPIVTEIMNISTLDLFADVDIIQVGARNMQNFDLLKELGKTKKPILPQARSGQHPAGTADECRIHYERGQRADHPV